MLTPQNISATLKHRAEKIIDQQRSRYILIGSLVILSGFITSLTYFEYMWPALILGIIVGVIIIAVSQNLDIPISALQLYAYGEIIDRLNEKEQSPHKPATPPLGPNSPKPQPTQNTVTNPSRPAAVVEQLPTWKRVQLEMEAKRKAEQEQKEQN